MVSNRLKLILVFRSVAVFISLYPNCSVFPGFLFLIKIQEDIDSKKLTLFLYCFVYPLGSDLVRHSVKYGRRLGRFS